MSRLLPHRALLGSQGARRQKAALESWSIHPWLPLHHNPRCAKVTATPLLTATVELAFRPPGPVCRTTGIGGGTPRPAAAARLAAARHALFGGGGVLPRPAAAAHCARQQRCQAWPGDSGATPHRVRQGCSNRESRESRGAKKRRFAPNREALNKIPNRPNRYLMTSAV